MPAIKNAKKNTAKPKSRISKKTQKTPKKKIAKVSSKKQAVKKKRKTVSKKPAELKRYSKNPVIEPGMYPWESMAVFNPAAVSSGGRVHLFYRALGPDGVSRVGYASSPDGLRFDDRLSYPVYFIKTGSGNGAHSPYTTPVPLVYDQKLYASGGGWGGCEDPRCVLLDGRAYLTFNIFNGWNDMAVAVTSIKKEYLLKKNWVWSEMAYLSHPGDRQKNWVIFPEKFDGKFAVLHNLDLGDPGRVGIAYSRNLDYSEMPYGKDAPDPQQLPDHPVAWHVRTRSAAAPPIKTKDGWLLLYHAMGNIEPNKYKLGALLLDLKNPEKVLYRAEQPILEPEEWYENDWKPGIIYASGAVVRRGRLYVYYGGGDKRVAVATIPLSELTNSMKEKKAVKMQKADAFELN